MRRWRRQISTRADRAPQHAHELPHGYILTTEPGSKHNRRQRHRGSTGAARALFGAGGQSVVSLHSSRRQRQAA
jgi:hypothetical protein